MYIIMNLGDRQRVKCIPDPERSEHWRNDDVEVWHRVKQRVSSVRLGHRRGTPG